MYHSPRNNRFKPYFIVLLLCTAVMAQSYGVHQSKANDKDDLASFVSEVSIEVKNN